MNSRLVRDLKMLIKDLPHFALFLVKLAWKIGKPLLRFFLTLFFEFLGSYSQHQSNNSRMDIDYDALRRQKRWHQQHRNF
jgi:hypothetical protein